ncbi:MAG: hypothetical protein H6621_05905 [Halobacteriovoraceae bacterium]|nr:hypothetical protein [Halobacteriovoraceae bacterium]
MKYFGIFLLFSLVSLDIQAERNLIQSKLGKLITDSDAIVRGVVKAVNDGEESNSVEIKVFEAFGIREQEVMKNSVFVNFPGSLKDGVRTVDDSFVFEQGEEVLLFLRRLEGKLAVYPDPTGKYKVDYIGGKSILISSVISRSLLGGEVQIKEFYDLVVQIKNKPILWWERGQFVQKSFLEKSLILQSHYEHQLDWEDQKQELHREKKKAGRAIASVNGSEKADGIPMRPQGFPVFWLVLLLGALGGAARIIWKNPEN